MIGRHSPLQQIILKNRVKQIRLAAAANTGYHLDQTIALAINQALQIDITSDLFHFSLLP